MDILNEDFAAVANAPLDEPEVALARLNAALEAQDANFDALADFLSDEREAERQRQFDARMAELKRLRIELAELLR